MVTVSLPQRVVDSIERWKDKALRAWWLDGPKDGPFLVEMLTAIATETQAAVREECDHEATLATVGRGLRVGVDELRVDRQDRSRSEPAVPERVPLDGQRVRAAADTDADAAPVHHPDACAVCGAYAAALARAVDAAVAGTDPVAEPEHDTVAGTDPEP